MKYSPIKRDVGKYRFALPNNIWTRNLKVRHLRCWRISSTGTAEGSAASSHWWNWQSASA